MMKLRSQSQQIKRHARLLPNGIPRWVRIYDNGGKTADRFTCVYTGLYNNLFPGEPRFYYHTFMSENPTHPQGVGIFDAGDSILDNNDNGWSVPVGKTHPILGHRIKFENLPEACQELIIHDYKVIWALY